MGVKAPSKSEVQEREVGMATVGESEFIGITCLVSALALVYIEEMKEHVTHY